MAGGASRAERHGLGCVLAVLHPRITGVRRVRGCRCQSTFHCDSVALVTLAPPCSEVGCNRCSWPSGHGANLVAAAGR